MVVVGGGATGMAAAARLAKQGHQVTVVDGSDRLGGDLAPLQEDGCTWDAFPPLISLPAVLRDQFRKSGRPIERYVDLDVPPVARLHMFADGSRVRYVTGNRAKNHDAVADDLGARVADRWTALIDEMADTWQSVRAAIASPDPVTTWRDRSTRRGLMARRSREWLLNDRLPDQRLRQLASWKLLLQGILPADAPAWTTTDLYVERALGLWLVQQGPGALGEAMAARLAERDVTVVTGRRAVGLVRDGHQIVGVRFGDGSTLVADHVISSVREPWTGEIRGMPRVLTASWSHIRIRRSAPPPAPEIVVHGAGLTGSDDVLVRTTGIAPDGEQAWSVGHRGPLAKAMARIGNAGLISGDELISHQTTPPRSVPHPWMSGTAGQVRAARLRDARAGLTVIGPSVYPGPDLHLSVWGAALAAERLGQVPRTGA